MQRHLVTTDWNIRFLFAGDGDDDEDEEEEDEEEEQRKHEEEEEEPVWTASERQYRYFGDVFWNERT